MREVGGLGIYFALRSVDDFSYQFVDGLNRNQFSMNCSRETITPIPVERILIFDAPGSTREQMLAHLANSDYAVEATDDRLDVCDRLSRRHVDLLIIGDAVSHVDAFWLIKRIRLLPGIPDIATLVVSVDPIYIARCMELGVTDFARIPLDPELLTLRISLVLGNSPNNLRGRMSKLSRHIKAILLSDQPELRFGRDMNFDQYLEKFLIEVQGIYNADAGTLYMRTDSDMLRFSIVRTVSLGLRLGGTSSHEIDFPMIPLYEPVTAAPNHRNVASHVALTGQAINIPDIYENEDFDFTGTRWFDARNHYRSISTLTVPLRDHNDYVIGVVQLINAQDEYGNIVPFDRSQQMIVEALCAHTAVVLTNQRLLQRQAKLAYLESDLKIGRGIQRDFMPSTIPQADGWQIDARFYPAREVAGDFYDIFSMDDSMVMIIADVCDKGVGAALFMALIRSLLRAFIKQARESVLMPPQDARSAAAIARALQNVVHNTNDYILEHHYNLNMFATLFIGMLGIESGEFFYINAGHTPPPLIIHHQHDDNQSLNPSGPAVGMFEDARFQVQSITLQPGDLLMAYTDGLTDIKNREGTLFGDQAMRDLLTGNWHQLAELITGIESAVFNHMGDTPQFDDMTFWGVYRNPIQRHS
jgi:sigma-B regulation protein RsbU (phosphoserine phosphatase)